MMDEHAARTSELYLLTAVELSPGGSTHLHTNNTQNNTNNNQTTQIQTNVKECGTCPVFASFTLAFALQLRKKHVKTSVRVRKTSVRFKKNLGQNTVYILPKHPQITKPPQTHTLQNPHINTQARARARARAHAHTHTHTQQNNIKPRQYKLKQTAYNEYEILRIGKKDKGKRQLGIHSMRWNICGFSITMQRSSADDY
jgi:hypothetical protein